mmetsp:Transcript_27148/g.54320  ORF Transcript_27148/g.54320 Transcript_27148/m.54320 type:complete len:204 (-) Transcript_27148:1254-1865(-)
MCHHVVCTDVTVNRAYNGQPVFHWCPWAFLKDLHSRVSPEILQKGSGQCPFDTPDPAIRLLHRSRKKMVHVPLSPASVERRWRNGPSRFAVTAGGVLCRPLSFTCNLSMSCQGSEIKPCPVQPCTRLVVGGTRLPWSPLQLQKCLCRSYDSARVRTKCLVSSHDIPVDTCGGYIGKQMRCRRHTVHYNSCRWRNDPYSSHNCT